MSPAKPNPKPHTGIKTSFTGAIAALVKQSIEHIEIDRKPSSYFTAKTCHGQWMSEDYEPGLVSVILPTFNRSHFLLETIESVKSQTYRPIELIVVDDGSTDNTKLLIDQWISKSLHDTAFQIRYFYQDNKGAPVARNLGLIKSNGEYIQYLDSDDVLHPMKVHIHVTALNVLPKCDYVWSEHREFESGEKIAFTKYNIGELVNTRTIMDKAEVMKIPNIVWSGLYRRHLCVLTGPWNEDLVRWQDVEYNVRCSYLQPHYRYINAYLYFWRCHGTGRIEDLNRTLKGIQEAFKSLNAVENFLITEGINTTHIQREIVRYYFWIARQAMKYGTSNQVYFSLDGAAKHRHDRKFKLRLTVLKLVFNLFGGRIALFLFNNYSAFAIKTSNTKKRFITLTKL